MVSGQAAESYFDEDHFPEPISPKGRFTKRTFQQKGHFAERIFHQISILPKGSFAEAISPKTILPKGHFAENGNESLNLNLI